MTLRTRNRVWGGMALLLLLLFCVGGWLRNPPPKVLDLSSNLPDTGTVQVGGEVICHIQLATSWRQRPDGAVRIDLPEGVSLAPGARVRLQTLGWGVARWQLLLRLRPYRPGSVSGATAHLRCGRGARVVTVDLALPKFTVAAPQAEPGEPEAAPLPEAKEQASGLGWLVIAAIGALFWFWRRRRRRLPPLPSTDETAPPSLLSRLETLRPRLGTPDATLFAALCDLVAEHLQADHNVPAEGLTLREQAAWLGQSQALRASLAERLTRFWRSAEAVRFAGKGVTPEQADEAFAATRDLLTHSQEGPR